ncbi:mechanosensitive ion channel domain-containing protein [Rhizobium tubonense]|uniref:Mechanosensitive ion channel protein n=1 Tax=Rhizobium tubonense TaxID=484088 RepID=A0A2W4CSE0_9HYPH|nr:mechanosensitive ion channel family protein [Rhizobium tubonense]PZM08324.1 mechanosensitive ion channel protein [Rhizobium tubonense]
MVSFTHFVQDPIAQFAALVALALIARILARGHSGTRFSANVVFFALLTVLLVSNSVAPWIGDTTAEDLTHHIFIGLAKATWWIGGAMTLVSGVRLFLIFERKPREGRLIQDLLVGLIYSGAALAVIAFVFSLPVGTLIATSGVFAIVLGLALQSTLNDVFSGIALNLGRPYTVGDWIALEDGVQGRVVETNWRATHLLNNTNDLIIVPNSALAKARLTNLTGTDEIHGATITVRLLPTRPPAVVEEAMKTVLLSANCILTSPPPSVSIVGVDSSAIEVELAFKVSNLSRASAARNEIYDLVFRHAKAAGLQLGAPHGAQADAIQSSDGIKHPGTAWRLLNSIALFSTLTEDEMESLAASMKRLTFKKDMVIAPQDASMTSLMIVRSGVVVVEKQTEESCEELTRLAPGDLFGERGVLMGTPETARIRALTFVVVYEISKDHLATVMHDRPSLSDELGQLLAKRMQSEEHLGTGRDKEASGQPTSLAERIRHLFEVPHTLKK